VRRLALLGVLVALGFASSACNVTPPAATVNGEAISQSTLQSEMTMVASNTDVRCALGILTGQKIAQQGAGSQTVPTELADAELTELVNQAVYTQALSKLHSPVDSQYISYATNFMPEYLTPASGTSSCGINGSQLVQALPHWFLSQQVDLLAAEEKLISAAGHVDLGPAGIQDFYNKNPGDFTEFCMDVVAESTQAKANADRQLILHGASLSSVATASLDGRLSQYGIGADGTYPCEPSSNIAQYQANWAAALDEVDVKQGVPTPAFQDLSSTDQGGTNDWLVIELVGKKQVPLQSVATQIQEYLVSQNANVFVTEQAKLLKQASVTVDPQYGSWETTKSNSLPGVRPPVAPTAKLLLNSGVDSTSS
jgi:hypothetical protein